MNKLLRNILVITKINSLNQYYTNDLIQTISNILVINNVNPLFLMLNIFPSYYSSQGISSMTYLSYDVEEYVKQKMGCFSLTYAQVLKLLKMEKMDNSYFLKYINKKMKKKLVIESKNFNIVLNCIQDVGDKLKLKELEKILDHILPKKERTKNYNYYDLFRKISYSLDNDNDVINKGKFLLTKMKETIKGRTYDIRERIIKYMCRKYIENTKQPKDFIDLMKKEESVYVWSVFLSTIEDKLIEEATYLSNKKGENELCGLPKEGLFSYTKKLQEEIDKLLKNKHFHIQKYYSRFCEYKIIDKKTYNQIKEKEN